MSIEPIDLLGDVLDQLDSQRAVGTLTPDRHSSLSATAAQRAEHIATFEDMLHAAQESGLAYIGASFEPETGELFLRITEARAGAWIARLTLSGYSFADPISTYRTAHGSAAEAVGPQGRRVVLQMNSRAEAVPAAAA